MTRAQLIADPERAEAAAALPAYRAALARRLQGEPVAYILGTREFFGLAFEVTPAVLIPRPETELLVELALERLPQDDARRVLDIGTGSGCIAVSLAARRPAARVVATDVSQAALEVAARNAQRHGVRLDLRCGSLFEPVRGERFDLIVANPPYIDAGDPHLAQGDLRHEPRQALTPGADGARLLRTIVQQAAPALAHPGWLLLEHGFDQADAVTAALTAAGFGQVSTVRDLGGQARVSLGRIAPHEVSP
jgi:release factor glutamine methyltransferase